MLMRVATVTVNASDGEHDYAMDRPSWETNKVVMEMQAKHPNLTSVMLVLLPITKDV
jgi:hypothetical protein